MIGALFKLLWHEGTLNNFTLMTRNLTYCLLESQKICGKEFSAVQIREVAVMAACGHYIVKGQITEGAYNGIVNADDDFHFVAYGMMAMMMADNPRIALGDIGAAIEDRTDAINAEMTKCRQDFGRNQGSMAEKARREVPLALAMMKARMVVEASQ